MKEAEELLAKSGKGKKLKEGEKLDKNAIMQVNPAEPTAAKSHVRRMLDRQQRCVSCPDHAVSHLPQRLAYSSLTPVATWSSKLVHDIWQTPVRTACLCTSEQQVLMHGELQMVMHDIVASEPNQLLTIVLTASGFTCLSVSIRTNPIVQQSELPTLH